MTYQTGSKWLPMLDVLRTVITLCPRTVIYNNASQYANSRTVQNHGDCVQEPSGYGSCYSQLARYVTALPVHWRWQGIMCIFYLYYIKTSLGTDSEW